MANIGVNTNERESQGSSVLTPAPLYNIGIFAKTPKGVTGKAVLVTSIDSFRSAFGGPDVNYYAYYMMKGLFSNSPSGVKPNVYVVREYDSTNPKAAAFLNVGTSPNYFKLSAGYFGDASPGIHGNDLRVQFVAGSTPDTWYLNIYEEKNGTLTLVESTSEFEKSDMASTINTYSKWIKCDAFGDLTSVTLTADNPNYKIWTLESLRGNYPAVLNGTTGAIDSLTGFTTLSVELTIDATTVTVTMSAAQLLALVDPSDLVAGDLPNAVVMQKFVTFINLSATTANPLVADFINSTEKIEITSLSAGVDLNAVVDSNSIDFTVVDTTTGLTLSLGYNPLASGTDPGVPSNSQLFDTQAKFLEGKELQYAMSFDRYDLGWAQALDTWCKGQGSICGIFQADNTEIPSGTFSQYATLLVAHSFVAGYFNWGYVDKEVESGEILIPSLGHIFGAYYVKRKVNFGNFAHIAPGGVDVSVLGLNRLQWTDDLTPNLITLVARKYGFNTLKYSPGYGFVVESSRTFSTRNKYYSIHIRTSKNFIIQTISGQMKVFQQRPNNPSTRSQLASTARLFLGKRYTDGMFEQEGGFENNVGIKCDTENNDITVRKNRQLVLDLSMNFVEISEEVNISIIHLDGGIQTTEG